MTELQFPPLFTGLKVGANAEPFRHAKALAIKGEDPGTVVYQLTDHLLRASILFAPDVPLQKALAMIPACGLGFQNALGSLAPPEVAVHFEWDGAIRINGARCGSLKTFASSDDPVAEPDWMIIGVELRLQHDGGNPGDDADITALIEEGCAEVEPGALIESWVRHTLYWINRWQEDGNRPLLGDWRGFLYNVGETTEFCRKSGLFVGIDDDFGAMLRDGDTTETLSLTHLVEIV